MTGESSARSPGLRVALLNPCYWPEVRRGAERIARELANGLIERGHTPRLITSHPGRPSRSVEDGLEVVRNWRPPGDWLSRRAWEDHLTHLPFSYLSLLRGSDDVAHALQAPDAVVAARWSRRTGRPAVFAYMGIPDRRHLLDRRWRIGSTMRAVNGCAATTVLSRHAAEVFRRDLGVEARVIHPGVDLEAFAPGEERAPEPTIFSAAPLDVPHKRVHLLVEALPAVRRARPDARLVLLRPTDPARASELRRVAGVELIDPVERPEDLAPAYRRAWASALPSRGDSFGLVLAESLACGTPVVGTDADAIPEIVDRPEIGRLFAPDDRAGLVRALLEALELAEDPATAGACRARAEEFSTERSVTRYVELYSELVRSGRGEGPP